MAILCICAMSGGDVERHANDHNDCTYVTLTKNSGDFSFQLSEEKQNEFINENQFLNPNDFLINF